MPEGAVQPAKVQLDMKQLLELIDTRLQAAVDKLGLTKVDRRYAIFPTTDDMMGRNGPLTPEKARRVCHFFWGIVDPETRYTDAEWRQEFGHAKREFSDAERRDLGISSGAGGGYLVPQEFRQEVMIYLSKMPIMRNLVQVIPMGGQIRVPAVTQKPTLSWPGENAPATGTQPSFGEIVLNSNLGLALVPMSRQLFEHAGVDIVQLITRLFAEAVGLGEDVVITNGNGSNQPTGFRIGTDAASNAVSAVPLIGVTTANPSGGLCGDDIINLYYSVPSQYRANPKSAWVMNDSIIGKVRGLKDQYGRYLWADGGGFESAPARILGRPVLEQSNIPTNLGSGSPANQSEIWFGDWFFYYFGDSEKMAVEATTEGGDAFKLHQLWIKTFEEIDGKLGWADAFRYLTGVK